MNYSELKQLLLPQRSIHLALFLSWYCYSQITTRAFWYSFIFWITCKLQCHSPVFNLQLVIQKSEVLTNLLIFLKCRYLFTAKQLCPRVVFMLKHWTVKMLDINFKRKLSMILLLLSKQVTTSVDKISGTIQVTYESTFQDCEKHWNDNVFSELSSYKSFCSDWMSLSHFSICWQQTWPSVLLTYASTAPIFCHHSTFLPLFQVWKWLNLLLPCQV